MIEFPHLGLELTIDRVAFRLFGMSIYWYGIIIAFGFMLAVILGMRNCKKYDIDPENIIDVVLFATPAAIICARLYYVVFNWGEFKDNLLSVFNTRQGGLAIYGGIIGAFLVAYIFCRVKKIKVLKLLDFAVPYIAMAQAIGRWGNFVNQEAFGVNTDLPWGMTGDVIQRQLTVLQLQGMNVSPDKLVHPTFLYESLLDFAIFLFLIWYTRRKKLEGEVLSLYLILYGTGRFFVESLRTDSLMLGSFRISQVLSLALVITLTIVFFVRRKKASNMEEESVEIGESSYGAVLRMMEEDAQSENPDEEQQNIPDTGEVTKDGEAEEAEQEDEADKPEKPLTDDR